MTHYRQEQLTGVRLGETRGKDQTGIEADMLSLPRDPSGGSDVEEWQRYSEERRH